MSPPTKAFKGEKKGRKKNLAWFRVWDIVGGDIVGGDIVGRDIVGPPRIIHDLNKKENLMGQKSKWKIIAIYINLLF
jgi:hypothetical protein